MSILKKANLVLKRVSWCCYSINVKFTLVNLLSRKADTKRIQKPFSETRTPKYPAISSFLPTTHSKKPETVYFDSISYSNPIKYRSINFVTFEIALECFSCPCQHWWQLWLQSVRKMYMLYVLRKGSSIMALTKSPTF